MFCMDRFSMAVCVALSAIILDTSCAVVLRMFTALRLFLAAVHVIVVMEDELQRLCDLLDAIILFTAEDDAYGSFSVDSSHHRFNRYRLVDNSGDERRANQRRRTHMTKAERKSTWGKTAGAPPGKR